MIAVLTDATDYGIGKGFPTSALMRCCLTGPYGKNRIKQKDPLTGPTRQISALGTRCSNILTYLLENVSERRREQDSGLDRKAEAMGLAGLVIRVLTQNDQLDTFERTKVEGIEYLACRWINCPV